MMTDILNEPSLLINSNPSTFNLTTKCFGTLKGQVGYKTFDNMLNEQVGHLIAQGMKHNVTTIAIAQQILIHGDFLNTDSGSFITLDSVEDIFASIIENKHGDGVTGIISDGDHTFNDLYNHRCTLFLSLMRVMNEKGADYGVNNVWYSRTHADGEVWDNYLIVGMSTPYGECTYHVREDHFLPCLQSANITELDHAPEWDGHNSNDVLFRLAATFLGQS